MIRPWSRRATLEDDYDLRCSEARVAVIRLALALAVAMKVHMRIGTEGFCFGAVSGETKWSMDWDRMRLRSLLTKDEFAMIDSALGLNTDTDEKDHDTEALLSQPPSVLAHFFAGHELNEGGEVPEDEMIGSSPTFAAPPFFQKSLLTFLPTLPHRM